MGSRAAFDEVRCKGCEWCVKACARGNLFLSDRRNQLGYRPASVRDMDRCTGCGICAQMCPDLAIEVWRARQAAAEPQAPAEAAGRGHSEARGSQLGGV